MHEGASDVALHGTYHAGAYERRMQRRLQRGWRVPGYAAASEVGRPDEAEGLENAEQRKRLRGYQPLYCEDSCLNATTPLAPRRRHTSCAIAAGSTTPRDLSQSLNGQHIFHSPLLRLASKVSAQRASSLTNDSHATFSRSSSGNKAPSSFLNPVSPLIAQFASADASKGYHKGGTPLSATTSSSGNGKPQSSPSAFFGFGASPIAPPRAPSFGTHSQGLSATYTRSKAAETRTIISKSTKRNEEASTTSPMAALESSVGSRAELEESVARSINNYGLESSVQLNTRSHSRKTHGRTVRSRTPPAFRRRASSTLFSVHRSSSNGCSTTSADRAKARVITANARIPTERGASTNTHSTTSDTVTPVQKATNNPALLSPVCTNLVTSTSTVSLDATWTLYPAFSLDKMLADEQTALSAGACVTGTVPSHQTKATSPYNRRRSSSLGSTHRTRSQVFRRALPRALQKLSLDVQRDHPADSSRRNVGSTTDIHTKLDLDSTMSSWSSHHVPVFSGKVLSPSIHTASEHWQKETKKLQRKDEVLRHRSKDQQPRSLSHMSSADEMPDLSHTSTSTLFVRRTKSSLAQGNTVRPALVGRKKRSNSLSVTAKPRLVSRAKTNALEEPHSSRESEAGEKVLFIPSELLVPDSPECPPPPPPTPVNPMPHELRPSCPPDEITRESELPPSF
ncbi:hypothetical protein DIPPA_65028 [Diplonema papillatum]|nr:hypothetical protein DIPPA_65028 [Diplonema papillatum]